MCALYCIICVLCYTRVILCCSVYTCIHVWYKGRAGKTGEKNGRTKRQGRGKTAEKRVGSKEYSKSCGVSVIVSC